LLSAFGMTRSYQLSSNAGTRGWGAGQMLKQSLLPELGLLSQTFPSV
jgi:hypothetical protein